MGYCHFFFFFSPWRVGALFVVFTPKNQLKECHFDGVHGSEFRLNSFCSWRSIPWCPDGCLDHLGVKSQVVDELPVLRFVRCQVASDEPGTVARVLRHFVVLLSVLALEFTRNHPLIRAR